MISKETPEMRLHRRSVIPDCRIEELKARLWSIEKNKYGLAHAVPELLREIEYWRERYKTD